MAPVHQNVHKALCANGLNARMLKEISPVLALIFNESLARGDVTNDWQQANSSQMLIRSLIRTGVTHIHLLQNPRAYSLVTSTNT